MAPTAISSHPDVTPAKTPRLSAMYASLYPKASGYTPVLDDDLVTAIGDSGFTTVILGLFHVAAAPASPPSPGSHLLGDIVFNQGPAVVSNGTIQTSVVGTGSDWAHYLHHLKRSGSVDRIYLSFGGGSVRDFRNIASFVTYLD
ncbi:hypothetical protein, partial [Longimicrobium sp.]|uniref:hypothetical protein n=1 Tax=Longimicrobium sp. TaxID=2029185 RepID=UPI002E316011